MEHYQLEIIEEKDGKCYFQLEDDDEKIICKSIIFNTLNDCHQAILIVKAAAANTHLKKIN